MKRLSDATVSRLVALFLIYAFSSAAVAQNVGSVVESQGISLDAAQTQSSSNSDALSLLLEQNQQLRAELQALRGIVEEQGFELRKLQRDALNRYTSNDERLTALEGGASASSSLPTQAPLSPSISNSQRDVSSSVSNTNNVVTARESVDDFVGERSSLNNLQTSNRRGSLQPAVLSEQQLYQMAYDSVINSDFERSIAEFDQYMSVYPSGRFVTNAHYWKGQAYLYLERYSEAKESYEIILNRYEDSAKLADAMYGLGLAYQGLGNVTQARQLLNEIKRRFPNTGVANLADTKLLQLD
ncbi:MAG: tol-pal system protein YbgF [Gammaproteobacteria bacterium]|nr:tol-pal system protein YbgF [Gammaproteobacteria bacterium]